MQCWACSRGISNASIRSIFSKYHFYYITLLIKYLQRLPVCCPKAMHAGTPFHTFSNTGKKGHFIYTYSSSMGLWLESLSVPPSQLQVQAPPGSCTLLAILTLWSFLLELKSWVFTIWITLGMWSQSLLFCYLKLHG